MRIAIATWNGRRIGGVEDYLARVIPALSNQGHQVLLWSEVDAPLDRAVIAPAIVADSRLCVAELGCGKAIDQLRAWRPDVIYVHGLQDPEIEQRLLRIAPGVCFAHNYYGTCISGAKTFKNPTTTPCHRSFGKACLLYYYPRRCGGWNPITMAREFRRQTERLALLAQYKAILTLSSHMQQEYVRHGFNALHVFDVSCDRNPQQVSKRRSSDVPDGNRWRLLFVGRMEALKGGLHLLEALPTVARAIERPIHVTFAGEGRERHLWQERAATLGTKEPNVTTEFPGWITGRELDGLFDSADLLVVPSLWPEPFALIGLKAAQHCLPSAAYAVGGIPDWLRPGLNGHLADGNPPKAENLAQAIIECLRDPQVHARLQEGAGRLSPELVYQHHVHTLVGIFEQVTQTEPAAGH